VGDEPGGSAWAVRRFIFVESPLPWPKNCLDSKRLPAGMKEAISVLHTKVSDCGLIFIAPDPDYSVPDRLRFLEFDFGEEPRRAARRRDILVPEDAAIEALDALALGTPLPETARIDQGEYRDVLVCTHGARDACCATFGFPIYRSMRNLARDLPRTRVWRASHFGGHRFAPTIFDLPDGRSWGFLDDAAAEAILLRAGDPSALRGCYRGWAGLTGRATQRLEGEAFFREGWSWLDYPKESAILERDADGNPSRVAITAYVPNGDAIEYRATLESGDEFETMGSCNSEPIRLRRTRLTHLSRSVLHAVEAVR
jgi:hypothetical protein